MRNDIGSAHIIRGNALALPLPDASVDLVCTSPPYFGLRSYQDAGAHYQGQIGSEATPAEFLAALLAATREMVRVLKPSGSLFVNLGDKYNSGPAGNKVAQGIAAQRPNWAKAFEAQRTDRQKFKAGVPVKSLMGIPWRYAINCIDQLGLILRAEIIWAKPNGLPESVTDRVRRSHEQWFHFTKQPKYFAAVDEIREPQKTADRQGQSWSMTGVKQGSGNVNRSDGRQAFKYDNRDSITLDYNPLGKLPGSVWTIPTQPLEVPAELGIDHFAAYPMEWPRRIIQGWTPTGICTVCGEGRRPTGAHAAPPEGLHSVERRKRFTPEQVNRWRGVFRNELAAKGGVSNPELDDICDTHTMASHWTTHPTQSAIPTPEQWEKIVAALGPFSAELNRYVYATEWVPYLSIGDRFAGGTATAGRHRSGKRMGDGAAATITGYSCGCATPTAPTRPSVVLDPFGGTGTTALVAKALGRTGITIDLSADYCRLAEWRCNDPGQLAAALQVEKPVPVPAAQLDLFGEEGG